jgi:hypothetical protein
MNTNCNPHAMISPTNNSEPSWEPDKWKVNQKYNNCYAYAMDDLERDREFRHYKPIPGANSHYYTCSQLIEGLKDEIPHMYPTTFHCQCEPGYKKIYMAVSNESSDDGNDFHFWRQDSDGYWSHKPGSNHPSRVDGNGHVINNPDQSNRNSEKHSYTNSCGFFCIPVGSRDKPF